MVFSRLDTMKVRVRETLASDEFQHAAAGRAGEDLLAILTGTLRRRSIAVTVLSVARAEPAALADYAATWKVANDAGDVRQTNWFSVRRR